MTSNPVPRSVMIIDDSDVARAVTHARLTTAGYLVFERSTPLGATKDLIRKRVDAVLIDLDMPMMRGDAFASLLRRNVRLDFLAVVILSGGTKDELEAALVASGADAAIRKEEAALEMIRVLDQAIARRREMHRMPSTRAPFLIAPATAAVASVAAVPESGEFTLP